MEDPRYEARQKKFDELWEKHKANMVNDEEGTYVNLTNFNLADHDLTMEDTRVQGNQSFSITNNNRRENYFLRSSGGRFRLFKGR